MPSLVLVDRDGEEVALDCSPGDTLFQSLLRNHVPPESVVVTQEGEPVSAATVVQPGRTYRAHLMERYDVMAQAERYGIPEVDGEAAVSRHFRLGDDVRIDAQSLSLEELAAAVERRLVEVVERYEMFETGETVVVAYSGGIDSSALLVALREMADELPPIDLRTVTIADYWTGDGTAPGRELLAELDVHNEVISADRISEIYGLSRAPSDALAAVRNQRTSADALSVANSFHRRVFEAYAVEQGIETICIGDHASDIIAGIVGGFFGAVDRSPARVPVHQFGPFRYAYPLAFHSKQHLTLYRYARTGRLVENEGFDPWQVNKRHRHFYYYLADVLQSYCPGLIHWLVSESNDGDTHARDYESCDNCGKLKSETDLNTNGICVVCQTLADLELLE